MQELTTKNNDNSSESTNTSQSTKLKVTDKKRIQSGLEFMSTVTIDQQ